MVNFVECHIYSALPEIVQYVCGLMQQSYRGRYCVQFLKKLWDRSLNFVAVI